MDVTKDDFDRLPPADARGTSKLYGRMDLMVGVDLRRASDPGEFLGRLITLFGPPDVGGGFVLRHRPTGLLITAYAAQSGPAYGGIASPPDPAAHAALRAERAALAETMLRAGRERPAEVDGLVAAQRALAGRAGDLRAPSGFPALARALEALVARTPTSDFARIDHSGDDGPTRVGVRDGRPFGEPIDGDKRRS